MKSSQACPKCDGRKLWRIENFATDDSVRGGRKLRVAVDVKDEEAGFFDNAYASVGYFDVYVCDGCGYSEFWAHDFNGLKHAPEQGIHLIDASPQRQPFR